MSSVRTRWSALRVVAAGIMVALAGICYSSWILEFLWPDRLDPLRSFLSELDAAHQPHREVYQYGDVLTACLSMLAAAVLTLPRPAFRGRLAITATGALAAFGAATIADALAPIDCIPGIDPSCPWQPSELLPQLHHIHALTSSLAVFGIFIAMIAATIATYRNGYWPLLRIVGASVLLTLSVATIWMMAADNLHGDYRLGLAQRIQVGGMSTWMVLWGVALVWEVTSRRRAEPPSPHRR